MIYFRAKALCQRAHLEGAEARLGLKKVRSTRSRHLVTFVTSSPALRQPLELEHFHFRQFHLAKARSFPGIVKCQHLQSLKISEEFKVNFLHLMTTLFISISSSEFWHR